MTLFSDLEEAIIRDPPDKAGEVKALHDAFNAAVGILAHVVTDIHRIADALERVASIKDGYTD